MKRWSKLRASLLTKEEFHVLAANPPRYDCGPTGFIVTVFIIDDLPKGQKQYYGSSVKCVDNATLCLSQIAQFIVDAAIKAVFGSRSF